MGKKYQEQELECLYCLESYKLNEVFVGYVNSKGHIVITQHLDCGPELSDKREKDGAWGVFQRTLRGFELK